MKNYYLEVLNLEAGATERDIKRAYRRLAKQYHPDRSTRPDAEERFVEIAEAYRFLTEVGPAPHQESIRYDYDPLAEEYERRRQEAREFAQQRAAERYRQRIIATKQVNNVLKIIVFLVALFELLLVIDVELPPEVSFDRVVTLSFGHFHMTGQYEEVILQRYVLHADYENVARIEPGSSVAVTATPLLNTIRWINVGAAPYQDRIYPAYSIYHGYRFMISLILILCAIFALFPIRSDNKAVTGAVVLLFFAFQLALF